MIHRLHGERARILDHGLKLAKGLVMLGVALAMTPLVGCRDTKTSLGLDQLKPGERFYIERVVTLERAKAVALNDRKQGEAILDSLNTVWGSDSLAETLTGIPKDPTRARLVNELLILILEAEKDSLITAPRPDRLNAPLPDVQYHD